MFIENVECFSRVLLSHVQSLQICQHFFLYVEYFLSYGRVLFISKSKNSFWQPPHAGKLLSVLKHMPQKYGPDAFFNFPGKSAAVCRYFKSLVCYFTTAIGYFHPYFSFNPSVIVTAEVLAEFFFSLPVTYIMYNQIILITNVCNDYGRTNSNT